VFNPFAADDRALAEYFDGVAYEALSPHRARALPKNRRWLRSRLRAFRPDVVHVHLLHAMFAVSSLRLPGDATSVLTHHHSRYLIQHRRPFAAIAERAAVRRFDCVVAPSESVRRFLADRYGLQRVACIPNGWTGAPAQRAEGGAPTVVCTAHFRPVKRHRILLEAFRDVLDAMPEARLVLLGDGPLDDELRARARDLGIAHAVEFPGSVDVWPWLARAHVFAIASEYEGSPVAVMEAMAAGLPVVSFDVPGIRDLVEPGATGFLAIDRGDFGGRLAGLLSDTRLRDRMGEAARREAHGLTLERTAARYFELYWRLIRRTPSSRSVAASEAR
jgi:glycosyltransferase involved in cell wall biosynthesis